MCAVVLLPDFLLGKAIEGDSHILFLSPRSCVFCLLWETFEFVLERSCFGPRIPSLGAFILETVAEQGPVVGCDCLRSLRVDDISVSLILVFSYILLRNSFLNFNCLDCNLTKIYSSGVLSH